MGRHNVHPMSEDMQKRIALEAFLDAWDACLARGCEPTNLAEVAIYVALTDLVAEHGESRAADVVRPIPDRIMAGDFTIPDPDRCG